MAKITDKRPPPRGVAIGNLSTGIFFEKDGRLCMKVHSMLIYCLSDNTQPAFKDTDIVFPVDVEVVINSNLS